MSRYSVHGDFVDMRTILLYLCCSLSLVHFVEIIRLVLKYVNW